MESCRVPTLTRLLVIGCGVKNHFRWRQACKIYRRAGNKTVTAVRGLPVEVLTCAEPFDNPATTVGLMMEFLLEFGLVTVTRCQSSDAARRFTFEGRFVEAPLACRGADGEWVPRAGTHVSQSMNTNLNHGLDHHWSLGCGHWRLPENFSGGLLACRRGRQLAARIQWLNYGSALISSELPTLRRFVCRAGSPALRQAGCPPLLSPQPSI